MLTRSASCKASASDPAAYPVSSNSLLERISPRSPWHTFAAAGVTSDTSPSGDGLYISPGAFLPPATYLSILQRPSEPRSQRMK